MKKIPLLSASTKNSDFSETDFLETIPLGEWEVVDIKSRCQNQVQAIMEETHPAFFAASEEEVIACIRNYDNSKNFLENFFHFLNLLYAKYIKQNQPAPLIINQSLMINDELQQMIVQYVEKNNTGNLQENQYTQLFFHAYLLSGKMTPFISRVCEGDLEAIMAWPREKIEQIAACESEKSGETLSLRSLQLLHLLYTLSKSCSFLHPGMKNKTNLLLLRTRILECADEAIGLLKNKQNKDAGILEKFQTLRPILQINMASLLEMPTGDEKKILETLRTRLQLYHDGAEAMKASGASPASLVAIQANIAVAQTEAREEIDKIHKKESNISLSQFSTESLELEENKEQNIQAIIQAYTQSLTDQHGNVTQIKSGKGFKEIRTPNDCAEHFIQREGNVTEYQSKSLYYLIGYTHIDTHFIKKICRILLRQKQNENIYQESIRLNILEAACKKMIKTIDSICKENKVYEKRGEIMGILEIAHNLWQYAESAKMESNFIFRYIQLQYQLGNLFALQKENASQEMAQQWLIVYEQIIAPEKIGQFSQIAIGKATPQEEALSPEEKKEYLEWVDLLEKITRGHLWEECISQAERNGLEKFIEMCEEKKPNWLLREGVKMMKNIRRENEVKKAKEIESLILSAEKELSQKTLACDRLSITQELCKKISATLFYGVCHIYVNPKNKEMTLPLDSSGFCVSGSDNSDYQLCLRYPAMLEEIFWCLYSNNKNHLHQLGKLLIKEKSREMTDSLTGMLNGKKLREDIVIFQEEKLSLISFKYVDFYQLNARIGRAGWDLVLTKVAHILQQTANSQNWRMYRHEGTAKFSILLRDVRDKCIIENICKEIQKAVENKIVVEQNEVQEIILEGFDLKEESLEVHPNFYFGAALTNERISETAFLALSNSEKKKTRISIFDGTQESDQEIENELYWASKIHKVLENPELLIPFAQPIVNRRWTPVKYEILMRILDKEKPQAPYLYMSAIAKAGKWPQFTQMIINRTLDSLPVNEHFLSFNIGNEDLVEEFFTLLETRIANGLDPAKISFELLETSLFNEMGDLSKLHRLKNMWFKLSIDDFGVGESTVERLEQTSDLGLIDSIKIDRNLVEGLPGTMPFIEAIVEIAQKRNLEVVAEWVENETIAQYLKEAGVQLFQGYFYGKPEPLEYINGSVLIH